MATTVGFTARSRAVASSTYLLASWRSSGAVTASARSTNSGSSSATTMAVTAPAPSPAATPAAITGNPLRTAATAGGVRDPPVPTNLLLRAGNPRPQGP